MNRPVQLWAVQVAAPACREVVELEAHEDPQGIVARSRASEAVAKSLIRSGAVFIDDISAETALLAQLPASREPSKNALQAKLNGGFFAVQIKGNIQTPSTLEDVLQELTAQRKRHDEELADVKKELADLKKERSPTRETRVEKELRDLKEELRKERKQERKERKQIGVALERLSDELGAAARTVLEVRSLVAPLTVPE